MKPVAPSVTGRVRPVTPTGTPVHHVLMGVKRDLCRVCQVASGFECPPRNRVSTQVLRFTQCTLTRHTRHRVNKCLLHGDLRRAGLRARSRGGLQPVTALGAPPRRQTTHSRPESPSVALGAPGRADGSRSSTPSVHRHPAGVDTGVEGTCG